MKVIAFDSSTEILSACGRNGTRYFEVSRDIDLRHAEQIIPLVELVLRNLSIEPRALDLVVAARGPGSFTGLRIGIASAKGLAAGAGCPCISVPTLDIYGAHPAFSGGPVTASVIDAKKKRFYTAFYRAGARVSEYLDVTPGEFTALAARFGPVVLTGPHAALLREQISAEGFQVDPDSRSGKSHVLLRLGTLAYERGERDGDASGPLYLRPPEAEIPGSP